MKKQLHLAGLLLCLAQTFNAQTHINQDFAGQINTAFQFLEKDRVPHGLLLDYAMEFTEVTAYNGVITDTNYVTPVAVKQIYHTLFMARIHTGADTHFISPQDYDQQWQNHRAADTVSLSGLCYSYSRFAPNALVADKLQVVNNQLTDKYTNGIWQDPYQTAKTFAIAPAVKTHKGLAFTLVFPQELWHTNEAGPIQLLEIDLDDGQGWQPLAFGQNLNVSYALEGVKQWQYRLTLNSGEILYSHSKIYIEEGLHTKPHNSPYAPKPGEIVNANALVHGTQHITATTAYNGEFGSATLLIDYAHPDEQIRNPLIVAEGFDPGILIAPEEAFGITDIDDFINTVIFSFSTPLRSLLTDDLTQAYDIIYVNWDNGVDYIQRNAYVLQEVIAWVNQQKAISGSVAPNVVWGQSMGGLIARYALADMEASGLVHDTALYISHDAPHLGANIPLGYQYFSRHALHQYVQAPLQFLGGEVIVPLFTDGVTPLDMLLLQNTPAARQMLINYVDVDYSINNSGHEAWQQELQAKGYPAIRNIAVSNGNHCSIPQNAAPGDPLFSFNGDYSTGWLTDIVLATFPKVNTPLFATLSVFTQEPGFLLGILPGGNEINMDFDVYAVSGGGQVYNGEITYTKSLFWFIDINSTLTSEQFNAPAGMLAYDTYPGGVYDTGIRNSGDSNNGNFWEQLLFKYDMSITTEPTFSFVPTASALDIGRGSVPLTHEDYQAKYNAETPPLAPKDTPFDNFTSSFQNSFVVSGDGHTSTNEHHIGLHLRNGNWLAAELDNAGMPQVFNCNFVCDDGSLVISGNATLCTSADYTVPVGGDAQVNWWVDDPGAVNLTPVANTVTLTANGDQHTAVTLTAEISSLNCNRVIEITKNIWVGTPGTPSYITGPETVVTGALVGYSGGTAAGATSYKWYLPYPYEIVANYDYFGQNWQMHPNTGTSLQAFTGYGGHSGYVQFMGENACGCGGAKLLYVTHAGAGGGGGGSGGGVGEDDPAPVKPGGAIPKFLPAGTSDDNIPAKETEYLLLYPNPADKKITVQLSGLVSGQIAAPGTIYSINVFDMLSRKAALSVPFTGEKQTGVALDISHLAPGYYTVIIHTDTGNIARKLIVK